MLSVVFVLPVLVGGVALAAPAAAPGPPSAWPAVKVGTPVAADPAAGQRVFSVSLRPGERLAVHFQTRGTTPVRLCLLSPLAQDADAPAPPALRCATAYTRREGALGYVATRTGAYGLDFVPPGFQPAPYTYTVTVTRRPQTGGEVVGGATVATAPLLIQPAAEFGDTVDGQRFWRLSVPPHSQISIRWANNGTMPGGQLALLAPGAAEGSPPLAVQTAGPTEHLTLSAVSRLGGRYVLDFAPAGVPVTYSFVAQVTPLDAGPMRTAVAVDLPKAVHKGRLKVTAVVQPATAQPHGRCRLEARRHGVWRSLKGVPVGRLGRCRFDVRLPRGTVLLRVRYVPAATFAPSTSPARRLTVS